MSSVLFIRSIKFHPIDITEQASVAALSYFNSGPILQRSILPLKAMFFQKSCPYSSNINIICGVILYTPKIHIKASLKIICHLHMFSLD